MDDVIRVFYRFPDDFPCAQMRGRTLEGTVTRLPSGDEAVCFGEHLINGVRQKLFVRTKGRPELEAAIAAHHERKKARLRRLEEIGWAFYEPIWERYASALAAYEAESEHGYPARAAAELSAAEAALGEASRRWPLAAAYAKARAWMESAHYRKSACGRRAVERVEGGDDPIIAVKEMEEEYKREAKEAMYFD